MPTFSLLPHSDHPPLGVTGVEVEVSVGPAAVRLTYRVIGADKVIFPDREPPARTDELWRTTCFELFLQFDDEERYVEFNFSPSTRWAAYAFDSYRDGMVPLDRDIAPLVERLPDGVEVDCDLGGLPHGELRMGLTAVIEETGGVRSFWSLAHAPGAPDFHHPACFAARLPAVEPT
jgi:hypothetical protein